MNREIDGGGTIITEHNNTIIHGPDITGNTPNKCIYKNMQSISSLEMRRGLKDFKKANLIIAQLVHVCNIKWQVLLNILLEHYAKNV